MKSDAVLNVEEMRRRARRRLPRVVFDLIDGGAGDETSVRGNREAYANWWIAPRSLVDVSRRDLRTTVLGEEISLPVMLAPCGFTRMCSADAELAVVRAAGAARTACAVSGASSYPLEDIKRAATGPTWYQFYAPQTSDETESELHRIKNAGYRVLCITVDSALLPIRDRDYYNKLSLPLKLSPTLIMHGLSRPGWSKDFMLGRVGQMRPGMVRLQIREFAKTVSRVRSITLDEIRWMKEVFGGPVVVKGIMRGDAVRAIIDAGIDGIVVSNHGGRNLDGARPSIEILPEVVAAADGGAEIYVDGGIRRGADVLKALALGARAVLIGRPYMWGLAAHGEAGVRRVIEILRVELEQAMALAGCPTVSDIDSSFVVRSAHRPVPVRSSAARGALANDAALTAIDTSA